MIESKITNYKCDRCGEKHSLSDKDQYGQSMWKWGTLWYAQQHGPAYLKVPHLPKSTNEMVDLCPDCMTELHEWYNKPKTGNF